MNSNDSEFQDDELDRNDGNNEPDETEDFDEDVEEAVNEEEPEKFIELSNDDYGRLSLTDQRIYRSRLEQFKKDLKRHNARIRQQAKRDRQKAGIPAGITKRLEAEWKKNLTDVQTNPERVSEFQELKDRLASFQYFRSEARAVIERIHQGVHAEEPGPGRFYEIVAGTYLEQHVKRFGLGELNPPFLIAMRLEACHHTTRNDALKKLQDDSSYRFRIGYGLDIDHVDSLERNELMEAVAFWYLENRDRPDYDYDWTDADVIIGKELQIPAKYLEPPFAGSKSVWTRLDNYRKGIIPTRYGNGLRTATEVLKNDANVIQTLRDLGYTK